MGKLTVYLRQCTDHPTAWLCYRGSRCFVGKLLRALMAALLCDHCNLRVITNHTNYQTKQSIPGTSCSTNRIAHDRILQAKLTQT